MPVNSLRLLYPMFFARLDFILPWYALAGILQEEGMFFDQWSDLVRTLVVGVLAYLSIVVLLRISGKRTLSKWNAFDFIVTIALGSTLATVILSKSTPLANGVLGFGVLIFLQYLVTWLSVRVGFIRRLVKSEPTLLLLRGEFVREAMRRERVTDSELRAALRGQGVSNLADVDAVVLETDGSFSIIKRAVGGPNSTLTDVAGYREGGGQKGGRRDQIMTNIPRSQYLELLR